MKALNGLGESGWSEYTSLTTLIDTAQIPRVSSLHYDNSTNILSFHAPTYPLYLVAKIEVLVNSSWTLVSTVPLKQKPYEFSLPRNILFSNLRYEQSRSLSFYSSNNRYL